MEIKGCKLEFRLIPQSPMIHFQGDEIGATLRASEMKPKLDRFLIEKFISNNINYEKWRINKEGNIKALDYKLKIQVTDSRYKKIENIGNNTPKTYAIYWGNTGNDSPKKSGIISFPFVSIICFDKELQEQIKKYISEFFWVTNFGTMQSKGFGGFLVDGDIPDERNLIKAFKINGAKAIYKIPFDQDPIVVNKSSINDSISQSMFKNIKRFYSVMKAGLNLDCFDDKAKRKGYAKSYIYRYMLEKYHMDNEKAWMKEKKISPNLKNYYTKDVYPEHRNPKYIKVLLGKGDQISYGKKIAVSVTHKKNKGSTQKLERVPSVIKFKIIGPVVYIIGKAVPKQVYNQEFEFKGLRDKTGILRSPSTEEFAKTGHEFPIKDFLDSYVNYYNGKCRGDLKDMQKMKKVVKCE